MPNLEHSDALAATRAERFIRDALYGRPILPGGPPTDSEAVAIAAAVVRLFAASEETSESDSGYDEYVSARRLVLRGPWEVA